MDNRAIGVYDSGIGGTTVFSELNKLMPNENFIYFGDTKNLPYGSKSKEELLDIAKTIFDFFERENVKAVVMACNTTSSLVYDELKALYSFEIYPIIQVAAKCIAKEYDGCIGVFATEGTIRSNKYKNELLAYNPNMQVIQEACPEWVRIVESGDYSGEDNLKNIKKHLYNVLDKNCKNIILGCTHYPYLTEVLEDLTDGKVHFINPAKSFVDYVKQDLTEKSMLAEARKFESMFYVSAEPEQFLIASKRFCELQEQPKLVSL